MARIKTTAFIFSISAIIITTWIFALSAWAKSTTAVASEPSRIASSTSNLPTGETVYKIAVDSTGIYEITFSELQAAGLNTANPNELRLSHRGQSVAFQFIGDNDSVFEAGEKIRFYGWAFDGSIAERQFVIDNIYWLETNSSAASISEATAVGAGTTVTNHQALLHLEEDHVFETLRFNDWESTGYEPDSTYWQQFYRFSSQASTQNEISVTLPYPDYSSGHTAVLTYVVAVSGGGNDQDHTFSIEINSQDTSSRTHEFQVKGDVFAIAQTLPITHLNDAINTATMTLARDSTENNTWAIMALNYITARYTAELKLYNHQLAFTPSNSQQSTFQIGGFSEDVSGVLVWEITDQFNPVSYEPAVFSNAGGIYTHTFNANHTENSQYVVAESAGFQAVKSIDSYEVPNIEPVAGYADWIAITHPDFQVAADNLATHRSEYSHLNTLVVSIEDIANIHNAGFVSPAAVKNYLQYAYDNWSKKPQYVVLIGDSNFDPRGVMCDDPNCSFYDSTSYDWSANDTSFVPFNYAYVDRYQGLVPSDYDFVLLDGDDLLPDMAIGRLAVNTNVEASNVVNKIIQYEENLKDHESWSEEIFFVHDAPRDYDFRYEISKTLPYIPDEFTVEITGQESVDADVAPIQQTLQNKVNSGVALLNWRGHGSTTSWGGNSVINIENPNFFNNLNQPMVIISMDCLDGNFTYPDRKNSQYDSVSEVFLRQASVGTAAHWSSTGLGFPYEHEVLAKHFYQALFDLGHNAIGDAIDHAKTEYLTQGGHKSEVYSFLLQGDPAMALFRPQLEAPTADAESSTVSGNGNLDIEFTWVNASPFTASNQTVLYYALPENTTLASYTGNISVTTGVDPNGIPSLIITFPSGIPSGTNLFTITLQNNSNSSVSISPIEAVYELPSYSGSLSVTIEENIYLPFVIRN